MRRQTFAIVGASLAGATAAATLRKEGFEGRIVLIGEEGTRPYERPELSKGYLRGEVESPVFVHGDELYADADIELRLDERAEGLDIRQRRLVTSRRMLRYDRLLLATGASARRLDIPGANLDGVVTLRSIEDADMIRKQAATAEHIVVVGGGWIGSEVAASLRLLGRNVTMVTPARAPLEHVLGPEVSGLYLREHRQRGVDVLLETTVAGFVGKRSVEGVTTSDGRTLPADLVIVGVGAVPRTELAVTAGLAVDNGIAVDERLESSVHGIFAAGDVANAFHPLYGRRLRVEHWDNARRQGRLVAGNMVGKAGIYDRIPYFYSDQFDLGMEYRGYAPRWDNVVIRGNVDASEFIAFWVFDGRIAAAMNVNVWNVSPALQALVRSGRFVDLAQLADPGAPLDELAEIAA